MKNILYIICFVLGHSLYAQKVIPVKTAHELAVAMDNGSFVGISDVGATVRISEFPDHLIIKNYTANSELEITNKVREEKTTEKATGLLYTGKFHAHPVKITMVIQDKKIRARIIVGEQKMVVVGEVKSNK